MLLRARRRARCRPAIARRRRETRSTSPPSRASSRVSVRAMRRTSSARSLSRLPPRFSGSSHMAEARHGIRLTAPLEHSVRKSFDSGVGLEADELNLLADCMNAMQRFLASKSPPISSSRSTLLTRIDQATDSLEQRIVAAARAAELSATNSAPSFRVRFPSRRRSRHLPRPFPRYHSRSVRSPHAASCPSRRRRPHGFRPGHRQHLHR